MAKIEFIRSIAEQSQPHLERICAHFLPNGKREGREWSAINPTRSDANPGSFKINLDTGLWSDFATGDKGGDAVSLVAYLDGGNQGKAAEALAAVLGVSANAAPSKPTSKPSAKKSWTPIVPVPDDADPPQAHPALGAPVAKWTYRDAKGKRLFRVYRFDTPDGKQFRPLSYWRSGDKTAWKWEALPPPRPLYNLDLLAKHAAAPVVLCEGEKAADAAATLMPDCVATTTPNGAQSPRKADWTPLAGRTVWIWPDNDEPGRVYAKAAVALLQKAGATEIRLINVAAFGNALSESGSDAADLCNAGWTAERMQELRQAGDFLETDSDGEPEPITDEPPRAAHAGDTWPRLTEADRPPHLTTDQANGYRLARQVGRNLLYVVPIGWHAWTGAHWARSEELAYRKAQQLSRLILSEAADALKQSANTENAEKRKELVAISEALTEWARKSESRDKVYGAMAMARPMLAIEHSELDRDNWLLNCANGVLDLRTGELRPRRRDDFITRCLTVDYDPDATCPTWLSFLARIFERKPDLIHFVRKALGYSLTGDTSEQCIFVLWGSGQNGKSTLITAIQALMGAYAQQAAPDLLLAGKHDRHPTEIAELRAARLVTSVETGDGRRLNENLVKQMSGGDRMRAHFMRQDNFEFTPTHKLFLATNHKPVIKGTDFAIWRRIRLIPFNVTIPKEERDPKLTEKFKSELAGILAWVVQGCLAWQKEGLEPPEEVTDATDQYRAEMDVLAAFFDERCVVSKNAAVAKGELYEAYRDWCDQAGERAETQRQFSGRMQERGFEEERRNYSRMWRGIGLAAADQWQTEPHSGGRDASDASDAESGMNAKENSSRSGYTGNNVTNVTNVTEPSPEPPPADSEVW